MESFSSSLLSSPHTLNRNNAKVNTVKVSEAENLAIVQQMKSELATLKQREEELDRRHKEMQALMDQQKLVGITARKGDVVFVFRLCFPSCQAYFHLQTYRTKSRRRRKRA